MVKHSIPLYYTVDDQQQLNEIQTFLSHADMECHTYAIEKINQKFLRLHPELALILDETGISLAGLGMRMNPDWSAEIPRLKRATPKSELLARACQINEQPHIFDATAGLGHDGLLLAHLGANVTLIERHPILFLLLKQQHSMALNDPFLMAAAQRIQLIFSDAIHVLTHYHQKNQYVDLVYLDPMFPQRHQHATKKAQVKKHMQLLHYLLAEPDDISESTTQPPSLDLGNTLLPLAQRIAKRVIVKRPRHAIFLNQQTPDHQWLGDACRFDAYFQQHM